MELVCGALPVCDSARQAAVMRNIGRLLFDDAHMFAEKAKQSQPIAAIVIFVTIIVLERRFRGDELFFQRVSNADATAAALPAKS